MELLYEEMNFNLNAVDGAMTCMVRVNVEGETAEVVCRFAKAQVAEAELYSSWENRNLTCVFRTPLLDGFELSMNVDCTNMSDETIQRLYEYMIDTLVMEVSGMFGA